MSAQVRKDLQASHCARLVDTIADSDTVPLYCIADCSMGASDRMDNGTVPDVTKDCTVQTERKVD